MTPKLRGFVRRGGHRGRVARRRLQW